MSEEYVKGMEEQRTRRSGVGPALDRDHSNCGPAEEGLSLTSGRSLLGDTRLSNRANSPARAASMLGAQSAYGNRSVQRSIHSSPLAVQRMGWQRPEQGSPAWYLYGNENKKGGYDFGAGYGAGGAESGSFIERFAADLLSVNGSVGFWGENNNKDTRGGFKIGGGAGKGEYKGDGWGFDLGSATAGAEASLGSNGFSLGATANAGEGSVTLGKPSKDTDGDNVARFGLSAGVGAALRGHWSDTDGDGRTEYGYGFDIGPVSADFKTESPHRLLLGPALGPALGAVENYLGIRDLRPVDPADLPPTEDPADGGAPITIPPVQVEGNPPNRSTNPNQSPLDGGASMTNSILGAFGGASSWVPDFKGAGIGQPFMSPDGGMTGSLPDLGLPDLGSYGLGKPFMPSSFGGADLPSFSLPDFSF